MFELKPRRIVFYGRVSTEHEAQLSALENLMQWYDDQLGRHKEWTLVDKYIDCGITGTQAKKRPSFMQMIRDAEKGNFDLIVTREVCRFARNTVDTLEYTRKLKKMGIEVYFVEDNIWTFSGDGELRLTIMAAMAQEESRKDSERVRAGQKISRDNGVLYGNGNILGYDLHRNIDADGKWNPEENTYVINTEQAETVRMIYDMCIAGDSYLKISKALTNLQRKDATGKVKWSASKIGRILHNMTYAGYKGYNKSYTDDYLEHSRVKNLDRDSYIYVKGDWEPIVSEEKWQKVQEILAEKTKIIQSDTKGVKSIGKPQSNDVWNRKLRCSCGSSFRKNKWRTNKLTNEVVFGYQCYNQINNGAYSTRLKAGLSTEGYCNIRMIGDWKLEFMAKSILEELWTDRKDAVELAIKMIQDNYRPDNGAGNVRGRISTLEDKIAKYKLRLDTLLEMRMDNEITKEEYQKTRTEIESNISLVEEQLKEAEDSQEVVESLDDKLVEIRSVLDEQIDFSGNIVSHDIIDKVVAQIVPMSNNKFKWILNLLGDNYAVAAYLEGRKKNPSFNGGSAKDIEFFRPSAGCYCRREIIQFLTITRVSGHGRRKLFMPRNV